MTVHNFLYLTTTTTKTEAFGTAEEYSPEGKLSSGFH